MSKNNENKKVENNEDKKVTAESILEEGEIMRLSVKKVDSPEGDYAIQFESNGPQGPMIQALSDTCKKFDLICIPDAMLGAIPAIAAICMLGNPFAQDEEDEGDGEKSEEESKE